MYKKGVRRAHDNGPLACSMLHALGLHARPEVHTAQHSTRRTSLVKGGGKKGGGVLPTHVGVSGKGAIKAGATSVHNREIHGLCHTARLRMVYVRVAPHQHHISDITEHDVVTLQFLILHDSR